MHLNPLPLVFACFATGLLVRMYTRGSVYFRGSLVSRAEHPVVFWICIFGNTIIALGAWLVGLGVWRR